MIIVDSNMCEPEEERFCVRNQTSTEADASKTALFRSCPHMLLKIAQPN